MIAALLAIACAPRLPPGDAPTVLAARPETVLALPDATAPAVYLSAWIAAGSSYDPIGQEGLAALTAHAMAEAGAGDLDPNALQAALYPTGNALSVTVTRDWAQFRLRCPADQEADCVARFADVLLAPRFDGPTVERLRDEATFAVGDGLLDDEEALAAELLDAMLYEAHPYGHPVDGRAGVLGMLSAADVARFYKRHVQRSTVWVGMAGAVTPDGQAAMEARLQALPTGLPPDRPLPTPRFPEGRRLLVADTANPVTGFMLGHPLATDRNHADHWPLMAGMTAFGAHRQSFGRLFRTLRTDRGLNYGTYAYAEPYLERPGTSLPDNGALRVQNRFALWIRPTSQDNGAFALKLALDELEVLAERGLTPDEFDDIRSYLLGAVPLLAMDPGRRLAFALEAQATGTPNLLVAFPAALQAMTVDDVNRSLKAHLAPDKLAIAAVSGDAQALATTLIEGASTPIVYRDVTPTPAAATRDAKVANIDLGLEPTDVVVLDAKGVFR